MKYFILILLSLFFVACEKDQADEAAKIFHSNSNTNSSRKDSSVGNKSDESIPASKLENREDTVQSNELNGKKYSCFMSVFGRDTTIVNLVFSGNIVKGTMQYKPFEKDAAHGTLSGGVQTNGELMLIYDYMIEGNKQSETKIMKIEGTKLLIKVGKLIDKSNDGNLEYEDAKNAKYSEVLEQFNCSN